MEASTFDKVYCYPGTEVLINNFKERDPKVLSQLERMLTAARVVDLLKKPVKGKFDLLHLKKIHHYIFQDLYPWAGEIRCVNISKEILFCDAQYIEKEISKVFNKLQNENFLKDCREFIRELLLPLGFYVDYSRCPPDMMLYASINAFAGDYELMTRLFEKCIIEKPQN